MLTDLQRQKLTHYFAVFDVDDDGRITPRDFERVVENVRILQGLPADSPPHAALRDAFMRFWDGLRRSADANVDGEVDRTEWLGYWSAVLDSDEAYQAQVMDLTDRMFQMFDVDEDGGIGADEFCDFFGVLGMKAAVARRTFVELDLDSDGLISREELLELADQFYRAEDPAAPGNSFFGPVA